MILKNIFSIKSVQIPPTEKRSCGFLQHGIVSYVIMKQNRSEKEPVWPVNILVEQ